MYLEEVFSIMSLLNYSMNKEGKNKSRDLQYCLHNAAKETQNILSLDIKLYQKTHLLRTDVIEYKGGARLRIFSKKTEVLLSGEYEISADGRIFVTVYRDGELISSITDVIEFSLLCRSFIKGYDDNQSKA